jgi:hypothetical protein
MTKRDEILYEQIIEFAKRMDRTEDAVVGLMWAALHLACKKSQEAMTGDDKICTNCMFKYFNCHEIYTFCNLHGVYNKEEDYLDDEPDFTVEKINEESAAIECFETE